jgi:hypothetical protein
MKWSHTNQSKLLGQHAVDYQASPPLAYQQESDSQLHKKQKKTCLKLTHILELHMNCVTQNKYNKRRASKMIPSMRENQETYIAAKNSSSTPPKYLTTMFPVLLN